MNIQEILEKHAKWLRKEEGGERADLSHADLEGVDLRYASLQGANLRHAKLRYANLRYANLQGTNLKEANLRCASLQGTNLRYANLKGASLKEANMKDANLQGAYLQGAYLKDADLWGVRGNKSQVKTIHCDKYDVAFTKDVIQIGRQRHKIEEWRDFSDDVILEMDDGALEWWAIWKPIIFSIIEASPAI